MVGKNLVELLGYVDSPRVETTRNGYTVYHATIVIPIEYQNKNGETVNTKQYVPIMAWNEVANALCEVESGVFLNVIGSLVIKRYDSQCSSCEAPMKRRWAEVKVTNFAVVE